MIELLNILWHPAFLKLPQDPQLLTRSLKNATILQLEPSSTVFLFGTASSSLHSFLGSMPDLLVAPRKACFVLQAFLSASGVTKELIILWCQLTMPAKRGLSLAFRRKWQLDLKL